MATDTSQDFNGVISVPVKSYNNAPRLRPAYASFGDKGLTATANAHGHLLQITRYLGNEPSGFYCVDLSDTPSPNLIISRLEKLQSLYNNSDAGIRLQIGNAKAPDDWLVKEETPILGFIHNRWPLFTTETSILDLDIQYIVHDQTIYQIYTFKSKKGHEGHEIKNNPTFYISANLFIRDLNFVDPHDENASGHSAEHYSEYLASDNSRIIRRHKPLPTGGEDTVGLVIMPFINGQPSSIQRNEGHDLYHIAPGDVDFQRLKNNEEMIITIAYTLEMMKTGEPDASSLTTSCTSKATQHSSQAAEDMLKAKSKLDMRFKILSFTKDDHLNFILTRNLEHILSVCSIPTRGPPIRGIVPVALTCGDMSNHRVAPASSFYAFEMLLFAFSHLKKLEWTCACKPKDEPCGNYNCEMRYRIWRACLGHLIWIHQASKDSQNILCSHRWASGQAIKSAKDSGHLADTSITDLPFHLIKYADFCKTIQDQDIPFSTFTIKQMYRSICGPWIQNLDQNKKNNEYVFSRPMQEAVPEFFFSEQAIIWRALKSAEEFELDLRKFLRKSVMNYSALDVQNSVLEKFSCESLFSKKTMIAVSRSPYGNKFKLGAQDSFIFYAMDHGIFATDEETDMGQNKMESWMNTLDHQIEFGGNRSISWDDPTQAALAVITTAKSRNTNSNSMKYAHRYAKFAILHSFSPNGLFTGQLTEDKNPIIPSDLPEYHNYWHASFEIPLILWMYSMVSPSASRSVTQSSSVPEPISSIMPIESSLTPMSESHSPTRQPIIPVESSLTLTPRSYGISRQYSNLENQETTFINKENIVKYTERWLYSKPRFLTFQPDLREEATKNFCEENKSNKDLGNVISKAVEEFGQNCTASNEILNGKGYIINILGTTGPTRYIQPFDININEDLCRQVDPAHHRPTSAANSMNTLVNKEVDTGYPSALIKKRFMHFYQMDHELAMTCYRAFPEAEDLSSFFDRHASYDKYFYEDAQLIFNKWMTELHLSFYQVLSDNPIMPKGISEPKSIPFPNFRQGDKPRSIGRVSMSLRFDGDIFDSSWICHFIEYNPQWMSKRDDLLPSTEKLDIGGATQMATWQERRILELLILDKMLDTILQSSKNVLQEIKKSILQNSENRSKMHNANQQEATIDYDTAMLLVEFEILDTTPNDTFLSIRSAWHKFKRITDIVEEELKENITTITLWMIRKEKRSDEPQWPKSSQHKYGWRISQLSAINNRKFDELQRCYDSIKDFNASLDKRIEAASSKWEIQSSNDIRLFTYVTVVFLPISFATSIFSMSGAPSGQTLRHMIIVAAVALGATIIALFNAKALDSKMVRPVYRFCRYILKSFFSIVSHILFPCIYFVARYIYYPAFSQDKSDKPSAKASAIQEGASTGSVHFLNSMEKASTFITN